MQTESRERPPEQRSQMSFTVGQEVRLSLLHPQLGPYSSRGYTIATINHDDGTFDLIATLKGSEDEDGVVSHRIAPLEPFEEGGGGASALDLKVQGNALFKRSDYVCAISSYNRSLARLKELFGSVSVGSEVLVKRDDGCGFTGAMVSDLSDDATLCDVIYDEDEEGEEEEEEGVNIAERVISLAPAGLLVPGSGGSSEGEGALELQTALYLNLSKCCHKLRRLGWAVRYSSLVIAALQRRRSDGYGGDSGRKRLADALGVRCRSLLQCGRPQLAQRDAELMGEVLTLPSEVERARALHEEVQRYRQRKQREDRRLARDVAQWVDTAMKRSEEVQQQQQGGGGAGGADLMTMSDLAEAAPGEVSAETEEKGGECAVC